MIPARDEERLIGRCLKSVERAAARHGGLAETIVALNRCTDRTEDVARSFGARTVTTQARNLAAVRNAGARAATGDILITLDADSMMSPNALIHIERSLTSGRYAGGGAMILPDRWSFGITAGALFVLLMVLRFKISAGMFWVTRADFEALGGFDESYVSAEDIDFGVRLRKLARSRRQRYGTLWLAPIVTSCRKFDRLGDWFVLRQPKLVIDIIGGRNQAAADFFYYDIPR